MRLAEGSVSLPRPLLLLALFLSKAQPCIGPAQNFCKARVCGEEACRSCPRLGGQRISVTGRAKGGFLQLGAQRRVDTPPTLPRHLSTHTPRSCYRLPAAGCHENPEQLRVLSESPPRGDAGELGMLSSWGRLGWRVESFGSASHPLPPAPAPLPLPRP